MPFLELKTNKQLSEDKKQQVMTDLTSLISKDLNKPEKYIMVGCQDNQALMFGASTEPMAFIDLRSIRLPEDQTQKLSQSLSTFLSNNLEVSPGRVFINFWNVPPHMWGHNGSTF